MSAPAVDRVVITGIGAITPLGNSWSETWSGLKAGRSGVSAITRFDASSFPTRIAAEVKDFDPSTAMSTKSINRSSRASQFAVAAAQEAVADAGLGPRLDDIDAAVIVNSAVSGFPEIEDATHTLNAEGVRRMRPSFVASSLTNMAACEIAIDLGVHGPVNASALACASGAYALLEARRILLSEEADVVITGGTDSAITPVMFGGLSAMRALSKNNDSGHLIGAAGALAGMVCALSISEGVIPPTINYTTPDPECSLDYVPGTAREQSVEYAITNAFGFGGQNCVVAFGRV